MAASWAWINGAGWEQEWQQQNTFSSLFPNVREIRNQSIAFILLNLIVTITTEKLYIFLIKLSQFTRRIAPVYYYYYIKN